MIPSYWDEIDENSDKFIDIPPKGYVLKLKNLEEYINRKNGNKSLKICFDIDGDSEYKGIFQRVFDSLETSFNIKWPNEGTKYLSLKPENLPYLKNFIQAVEKSNDIKINLVPGQELDLEQFKNLLVGGEFGYEEYEKDGDIKLGLSLFKFKSLDQLPYIKEPQVKTLNMGYVSYDIYKTGIDNQIYTEIPIIPGGLAVEEEELPF